jgi:antitoxin (DNA-binding transcriptional repressor) of toxin-antitoxin stability system
MKIIDIKQLEARLSEYVRLAKADETVLVAERGEIVAELRPARRQTRCTDRLEELLDGLAASGEISRAGQPKGGWTWRSRGLGLPVGSTRRCSMRRARSEAERAVAFSAALDVDRSVGRGPG